MEPPQKKPRIGNYSSLQQEADQAARAAAVAAKLSLTLLNSQNNTTATSSAAPTPGRPGFRPTVMSVLGLDPPETVKIPSDKVGQIIGKGGSKIREIQERSGAKLGIAKISDLSTPHLRDVTLSGSKEAIDIAKKLIKDLFDDIKAREGGGFRSGLQRPDRTIQIPTTAAGLIIGKGGETIRKIIQETKCIIHVERSDDWKSAGLPPPKPGYQNVYFKGSEEALDKAVRTVQEITAEHEKRRQPYQQQQYDAGSGRGRGKMPQYGMQQQSYSPPCGMPPGPYGNTFAPGQNFIPPNQTYPPAQMYHPPPNLYPQQPYPQNTPPQPYPPNQQSQPYQPEAYPQNQQPQPYQPEAFPPGQTPYNPSEAGIPGVGRPHIHGYVGIQTDASSGHTPYNPSEPGRYNPAEPALNPNAHYPPPKGAKNAPVLGVGQPLPYTQNQNQHQIPGQ